MVLIQINELTCENQGKEQAEQSKSDCFGDAQLYLLACFFIHVVSFVYGIVF